MSDAFWRIGLANGSGLAIVVGALDLPHLSHTTPLVPPTTTPTATPCSPRATTPARPGRTRWPRPRLHRPRRLRGLYEAGHAPDAHAIGYIGTETGGMKLPVRGWEPGAAACPLRDQLQLAAGYSTVARAPAPFEVGPAAHATVPPRARSLSISGT